MIAVIAHLMLRSASKNVALQLCHPLLTCQRTFASRTQLDHTRFGSCSHLLAATARLEFGLDGSFGIRVIDWLVNAKHPQKVVFQNTKVEQYAIGVPRNSTYHRPRNCVENKVVGRRHNGCEDEHGIRHTKRNYGYPLERSRPDSSNRKCCNGEADE